MKKILILVGLPGSGKTTLGKELESQGYFFIDDISISGLNPFLDAVEHQINKIVIADTFLCRERDWKMCLLFLSKFNYELECIFFENNPEKCLKNVENRNDGRKVSELIKLLTKEYTIPDNAKIREIFFN